MNDLMIINTSIKVNNNDMYCLNDVHKASGGDPKDLPSRWLRSKKTHKLIESVKKRGEKQNLRSQKWLLGIEAINGGSNQGVYAHELLVISYAGWIDSDFQVEVNTVFLETMRSRLEKLEKEKAQLIEFKDDIYRRGIINGSLPPNTSGTSQRVLKAIQYILNSFRFKKEVKYEDIARYSINHHHHTDFNEAWEYVERNKLLEPRYPNRDRYTNWYTIRVK